MGTCTWTGGDNSWSWAASKNWNPGVPAEDDDVIIPRAARYNQPVAAAGTRVKSIRLEGGGLSTRVRVSERLEWLGGSLHAGVDLGAGELVATGDGGQAAAGDIVCTDATLVGATIGLMQGARLINHGTLKSSGASRLWWVASANPFLVNKGVITVSDGILTIDDVIGLLGAQVNIEPGATLAIKSATIPSYLPAGARVTGGGRLLISDGGRLYAVGTARISAGTTIELAAGGSIEDRRAATLYSNSIGPMSTAQKLTIDGRMLWTGGAIYGNVTLEAQGVLQVEGADLHQHVGGTLKLAGSGVVAGPARVDTYAATLRNDGDLLLQDNPEFMTGNAYGYDNRGVIRTSGNQLKPLGNNAMQSRGTLDLDEGTVRVGALTLSPRSRLTTHVRNAAGDGHGQLQGDARVVIDGRLEAIADGYAPAVGDSLSIVRSGGVRGRFQAVKMPKPVNGRFLRVQYMAGAVNLVGSINHTGIDASTYPGDSVMREVVLQESPAWVGYYLRTPNHPDGGWLGRRNFLTQLHLGMAVLYVGRQHTQLTAVRGRQDAADATTQTAAEGFPQGSYVYLDIEWEAGGLSPAMATYAEAWAGEMLGIGSYNPAIYCPVQDVAPLHPLLGNIFSQAGRADRPRFWVAATRRTFDAALPPATSGTPEAIIWQQDFWLNAPTRVGPVIRVPSGYSWEVDLNVSVMADPSAP